MNRKILVALIVVLSLCLCLVVVGTGALLFPQFVVAPPVPTAVPNDTANALSQTPIQERDLFQIVPRLKKNLAPIASTPAPRTRKVGETDTFFVVENMATGKYREITATLQVVSQYAYYWVENGMRADVTALQKAGEFFDRSIFPSSIQYFGEHGAGLDGDTRIHILNTRFNDAAGYFSSVDSHPLAIAPFSNQRNIIYLNLDALKPNDTPYNADTAHEFQHLIHNYQAQYKTGWIDEGMSDLAIKLNGFPVIGVADTFGRNPNTQLNTWTVDDPREQAAHYGASYLFFNYAAQRFGPDFTRAVIHAPREGVNGVQAALDARAGGMRFEDLFADWAVTNYLNDPSVENGKYAYANEPSFRISREPTLSQYPVVRKETMRQYAANYFALQPAQGDVTIHFTGTTTAKLLASDARSGRWMWYSNRADLANMTLTREFDLSRASKATLNFSVWFDIERNFDYAYVEASTDGGRTWDLLPGKFTTMENPNGSSYGPAYTGRSGAADDQTSARWVQEQMDLSAYAGKKILLRFEYITDDAVNTPGLALDDIAIPEIGFSDDVEAGAGAWQANGFVRVDNVLPQKFIVQVIERGAATRVRRVPLDNQNRGRLTLSGFGKDVTRAVLIVTAFAPTTTEQTGYEFAIVP